MPKSKKKRGSYTPPFTAKQSAAIAAAYRKGGNLLGLASQYKCSTSKIRKVLEDRKVKMRPRGPVAAVVKAKASKPKAKKVSKPKAKKASKPKAVNVKIAAKPQAKKVSKKANSGLAKALAAVAEKHAVAPSA